MARRATVLGLIGSALLAGAIAAAFGCGPSVKQLDIFAPRPARRAARSAIDARGADAIPKRPIGAPVATLNGSPAWIAGIDDSGWHGVGLATNDFDKLAACHYE
jgi:hypothetical protein